MTSTNVPSNVKRIIELASSIQEADSFVEEFAKCCDIKEKIQFIASTFGISIVGRCDMHDITDVQSLEVDYYAMLNTVINTDRR